ncbi:MAG: beta-galactosidase GalB [Planctomycetota bacterium]|jgi:beta-galactosidase
MKALPSLLIICIIVLVFTWSSSAVSEDSLGNLKSPRSRTTLSFNHGWKFLKVDEIYDEPENLRELNFNDSEWKAIDLPHDWAIEGPFTDEVLSAEGRLPFPGVGWYRKTFKAPYDNKRVFIQFDGVMRDAKVWLNGSYIGTWPYGYSSFAFELTPHLKFDGQDNIIVVKCKNVGNSSRWYPGSGIYRNVWLTIVNPVHVEHWGTYVTTPEVSDEKAYVKIQTKVKNQSPNAKAVTVETIIIDSDGTNKASDKVTQDIDSGSIIKLEQTLTIDNPIRWDIENPYMYKTVTFVKTDDEITDEYHTTFGIRTFRFTADKGFFLNGRNLKIKGVNLHHGLGPLGTAINRRAIERQLEIMKQMGCNAIRTAHNPPAPELLELCDKMGILVMDEAFDEWHKGKVPNGYHNIFYEWAEKDLRAMIQRDKNHPCIIFWSIGNEILGLGSEEGVRIANFLADICRQEDPTRSVTIGNSAKYSRVAEALKALDVIGWNYRSNTGEYDEPQKKHLKQLATETCALVSSRGEYVFPVSKKRMQRQNGQLSSYDLTNIGFGGLPDEEFLAQEQAPYVAGEFVWSGFDYLGEPEPCEDIARSTYFGIVDLCGFPKDRFYLYQSQWTTEPMVHLLPHWNWSDRKDEITPVYCYTNCDSAELFVNSQSLGRKFKRKGVFRLIWNNVKYEPGSIKVIAYDKAGKKLCSKETNTVGSPNAIVLIPDRSDINADGKDLSFITVKIVDKDGNFCPKADNTIQFKVEGYAEIAAVGNGNPMSYESFKADQRKAFNGLCLLVIRSEKKPGNITIKASSEDLMPTTVTISSR